MFLDANRFSVSLRSFAGFVNNSVILGVDKRRDMSKMEG
jgi:hypothetical protein